MADLTHTTEIARKIGHAVAEKHKQMLPIEVIQLEGELSSVVVDIEGVDYIATVMRVPNQRTRPASH